MLGKADATPMIAVKDIDRARKFYADTLGLKAKESMGGEMLEVKSGETTFEVYRSEFAGTNKATALNFEVDDIDQKVRALKDKGVKFEHYDVEGLQPEGRHLRRRGDENRLVQGPRRQYPQPVRRRRSLTGISAPAKGCPAPTPGLERAPNPEPLSRGPGFTRSARDRNLHGTQEDRADRRRE